MMGRIPAYCTNSFDGESTISGVMSVDRTNITANVLIDQGLPGGNRIGHFPSSPKKFIPPKNHKRPCSLLEVIKEFSDSYFEANIYKALYYHTDTCGNPSRKIRSEFREMISMGCSILTHYYDVISGEIGFRNESGKHIGLSYHQLASRLNVSLIRIKRLFKFLKERGLVTIIEKRKKEQDGNWRSNVSRKIINPKFFISGLGLESWKKICRYREWLIKKAKPKTKKQSENFAMVKTLIGQMVANRNTRVTKSDQNSSYKEKVLIEKAIILYEKDPSKALSEHLKYLKTIA